MAAKIPSGGGGSDDLPSIAEINVTPFVDVVLVLLVIFMVTAPMLVREQMNVNLPKAETGEKSAAQAITIAIDREGRVAMLNKPVEYGEIELAVKQLLAQNPNIQAVISADQETHHGDVVRIMDALKRAGLTHFAIQIERK